MKGELVKTGNLNEKTAGIRLIGNSGLRYKLRANLTVAAASNSFWLADRKDGIYSGGKVLIASNGKQGTHIGQEPDVQDF